MNRYAQVVFLNTKEVGIIKYKKYENINRLVIELKKMDFYLINIRILSGIETGWLVCKNVDIKTNNNTLRLKQKTFPLSLITQINVKTKLFNKQKKIFALKVNANNFIDNLSDNSKILLAKNDLI